MFSRRIFAGVKSLMHFDFPHDRSANASLLDEVTGDYWLKAGNISTASRLLPAPHAHNDAPRFGYKSLYSQADSDYVYCNNSDNRFSLSGTVNAEIFVYPLSSSAGHILAFMNGSADSLALSLTASRNLRLDSQSWGLGITGSTVLTLNAWSHVRVIASAGTIRTFVNGSQDITANIPATPPTVTAMRIGGANAMFDEFRLSELADSSVPVAPYQGALDLSKFGGFGTGKDGDFIKNSTATIKLNARAVIKSHSGLTINTSAGFTAAHSSVPGVTTGDEVVFFVYRKTSSFAAGDLAGLYAFRNIVAIDGNSFIIDRAINDEFNLDEALASYTVIAYKIPNFKNVELNTGNVDFTSDEIIAFKATGNVSWKGGTASVNLKSRHDPWDLSHSDLPQRMIPSRGNIIVLCGGTFSAPSSAFIGTATHSPSGYGASGNTTNQIMIGNAANNYYGTNILIAARRLAIDPEALHYGAKSNGHYSGLCYLAGDLA